MNIILKRIVLIVLCSNCFSLAYATEMVFIDDTLRVGVRTEPGNQTNPVAVVTSGAKLELLDQRGSYSLIRMNNGTEGWVRSSYLTNEPPAQQRVEKLEQELSDLQNKLETSTSTNQELNQKIESLNEKLDSLHREVSIIGPNGNNVWVYVAVTICALCGLAFTLGILWNKQQVAKKLGGHTL